MKVSHWFIQVKLFTTKNWDYYKLKKYDSTLPCPKFSDDDSVHLILATKFHLYWINSCIYFPTTWPIQVQKKIFERKIECCSLVLQYFSTANSTETISNMQPWQYHQIIPKPQINEHFPLVVLFPLLSSWYNLIFLAYCL